LIPHYVVTLSTDSIVSSKRDTLHSPNLIFIARMRHTLLYTVLPE
jgi:hypothetical protein